MKLLPITQRMLEKYEDAKTAALQDSDGLSMVHYNRMLVDFAVEAGFALDVPKNLDELYPYEVIKLTEEIVLHVAAAKAPPDPN